MKHAESKRGKPRTSMTMMFIMAFMVIVIAGMVLSGDAEAQFTVTACTDCHAYPPADGTARNTPPGAVVGSHDTHVTQQSIACISCHGDTTAGETNFAHRNGNIQMTSPIHSGSGAYSKGTSFAQVNDLDGSGLGTCSNIYCHSNVQASGGNAAADTFASPQWGTTLTCDACHGQDADETDGMPASGSHDKHAGSQAGEMNYDCSVCHNNGGDGNAANHANDTLNMDIDNAYGASAAYSQGDHTPGTGGYGSCSATACHGGSTETWGTDLSGFDECTRCHGTKTAAPATDAEKAPPVNLAGNSGTVTGGVSDDPKVGAHQAHINLPSGLTDVLNSTGNCNECHLVPSSVDDADHIADGTPGIAEVFPGSITPEKAADNGETPAYAAGSCTVYCHGSKMPSNSSEGSNTSPSWNDTTLLTGTPDLAGDCSVCHGGPPTSLSAHSGITLIGECNDCHLHFEEDGSLLVANRALHINGTVNVAADCDGCHAYPPDPGDGKAYRGPEGKGAHVTHVTNIAAALGVTLDPANDTYGAGAAAAVCGVCHTNNASEHMANSRLINFGDGSTTYQFGSSAPLYNGTPGSDYTTSLKTCSNISCHFQTTPEWESHL